VVDIRGAFRKRTNSLEALDRRRPNQAEALVAAIVGGHGRPEFAVARLEHLPGGVGLDGAGAIEVVVYNAVDFPWCGRQIGVDLIIDRFVGRRLIAAGQDADHAAILVNDRPAAVAVRGRRVGLHEVLPDLVLLDARHGAVRDGRFQERALIEQLVGEHHARKAENVHRVADLRIALREADGRIDAVGHAQEREIAPGVGQGLAGVVEQEQGAELLDLRPELRSVRQHGGDLGLGLHLGARECLGTGGPPDALFEIRPLAPHDPPRAQDRHRNTVSGRVDRRIQP
jgi:hypothetical protein